MEKFNDLQNEQEAKSVISEILMSGCVDLNDKVVSLKNWLQEVINTPELKLSPREINQLERAVQHLETSSKNLIVSFGIASTLDEQMSGAE